MKVVVVMIKRHIKNNLKFFPLILGLLLSQVGFADNSNEENIEIDLQLGAISPVDSAHTNQELLDVLEILASEPIPKTPRLKPPYKQQPPAAQTDFRTEAPQIPDGQQPPAGEPPTTPPGTPPTGEPPVPPTGMPTDPPKPSGNGNIPPILPPIEPPPLPIPPPTPPPIP